MLAFLRMHDDKLYEIMTIKKDPIISVLIKFFNINISLRE